MSMTGYCIGIIQAGVSSFEHRAPKLYRIEQSNSYSNTVNVIWRRDLVTVRSIKLVTRRCRMGLKSKRAMNRRVH
jgi:hypothetical protein